MRLASESRAPGKEVVGESVGFRCNVGSGRSELEDLDATLERRQPLIDVGE